MTLPRTIGGRATLTQRTGEARCSVRPRCVADKLPRRSTFGRVVGLRPARARLVRPGWASRVIGPAYDALCPAERRQLRDANPDSFFNVVRSPDDDGRPAGEVLEAAAASLRRLVDGGRYGPWRETLFIYLLRSADHQQLAVVGDVPTTAVTSGAVRPHELTRTAKEDELARHLGRLRVSSSPIGLTYRPSSRVDELVARATRTEPVVAFTTGDDVDHAVWALEPAEAEALCREFAGLSTAYIVDGHHRVAATLRVGDPAFLGALVPSDQLHLLPYHRVVAGPLPLTPAELVGRLGAVPAESPAPPARLGEVLLRADRTWWRFTLPVPAGHRPLDVAALESAVLRPWLAILEPRTDARLEFVPGHHDLGLLGRLADERGGVAFALHPPTVHQLMAEADAGRTLPAKSTWFEPKLRSGIFLVER